MYCDYCQIEYDPTDYESDYAMCWVEKGDCGCCGFKLDHGECKCEIKDE